MKYLGGKFSVPCSTGGVSDEELEARWEATFGNRKKAEEGPSDESPGETEGGGGNQVQDDK